MDYAVDVCNFGACICCRPGTQSNKFSARSNAGEIVIRWPSNDDTNVDWARKADATWQPTVQSYCNQSALLGEYKYMFSRLRDKHEILEEHIHHLSDSMADMLKIDEWHANNQLQSVMQLI